MQQDNFLSKSIEITNMENETMASMMRSNGKIYDVVAVCLTILTGLFIYVFIVDRKISKIEKNK